MKKAVASSAAVVVAVAVYEIPAIVTISPLYNGDKLYEFVVLLPEVPDVGVRVVVNAVVQFVVEIDGGVPVIWALVAVMEYESPNVPVKDSPLVYPEPVSVISSAVITPSVTVTVPYAPVAADVAPVRATFLYIPSI